MIKRIKKRNQRKIKEIKLLKREIRIFKKEKKQWENLCGENIQYLQS